MMNVCITNVAVGGWYLKGQDRLRKSLSDVGYQGRGLWFDKTPANRPPHSHTPYAFKLGALVQAASAGYEVVMWADASMWATQPVEPIFEHARQHGAALWRAGWSVGEWTSDAALPKLGMSRDEAMKIPLLVGGLVAICLSHPSGRQLLSLWSDFSNDRVSFKGPWSNEKKQASKDPRVLGHRHDMPSLSVLGHRLEIPPIDPPKWFAYATDAPAPPEATFLARGM